MPMYQEEKGAKLKAREAADLDGLRVDDGGRAVGPGRRRLLVPVLLVELHPRLRRLPVGARALLPLGGGHPAEKGELNFNQFDQVILLLKLKRLLPYNQILVVCMIYFL